MTTIREGYEAGVDAVIADNTISRGEFVDAVQTVITAGLSNAEGNAWVDAVAVEYNRLGQHNNPTYNSHRGFIISAGKTVAMALFAGLDRNISGLPESLPVVNAAQLTLLREERDSIDAAIDRMDVLIAAEPGGTVGRLVKDELREGKQRLRQRKEAVRAAIQAITGDPDS
jgi:hypothetical protein